MDKVDKGEEGEEKVNSEKNVKFISPYFLVCSFDKFEK